METNKLKAKDLINVGIYTASSAWSRSCQSSAAYSGS